MEEIETNEEDEICNLKETIFAQQKLLQKLYNELEVERESSAIAASEALAMILKLQGEKGVVKMEAEQYKRLTNEKMCHAEESLSVSEQLIYQREMEVAALDYQVQAYKYKLLSLGGSDPMISDTKFPEDLLQRSESLVHGLGRENSAPTYLEQVSKLEDRVKEIARGNSRSDTTFSRNLSVRLKTLENEIYDSNLASSQGVLDVFEVPQIDEGVVGPDFDKNETERLMKLVKRSSEKISRISINKGKFNEVNEGESSGVSEEIKLLNEIKLQLNGMQSEISSLKSERCDTREKDYMVSFMEVSLMEAMLHFWL